ncbi:hypothetical protein EVAR_59277_1 [Eumeta japonica]|uniref:Uncharacterized protein n=1 Tax=Eumeta variegata TaxID=151549 RepID=A0A4C1YMJ4_EUMVA|nr:hypothetical protein EVAR_59277_1 [Eumeta japonica]
MSICKHVLGTVAQVQFRNSRPTYHRDRLWGCGIPQGKWEWRRHSRSRVRARRRARPPRERPRRTENRMINSPLGGIVSALLRMRNPLFARNLVTHASLEFRRYGTS